MYKKNNLNISTSQCGEETNNYVFFNFWNFSYSRISIRPNGWNDICIRRFRPNGGISYSLYGT